MEPTKSDHIQDLLDSIIMWAVIGLVALIPLFFWPQLPLVTRYPLVYIYLLPKTIMLRVGVVVLLGMVFLRLALSVLRGKPVPKPKLFDLLMVFFIGLLWFSARNGLNADNGFYGSAFWREGYYTYRDYAIIFVIARLFGNAQWLKRLSYVLIFTTIAMALYAIAEAFYPEIQNFTNVGHRGRSGGPAGNAVMLGAYLVMPLVLIGSLLAQKVYKGFWSWAALAALGLGVPAAIFTFSRGAWLALLAALAVLAARVGKSILNTGRRQALAGAAVILAAATIVALGPRSSDAIFLRAYSTFNPAEESVANRIKAWKQALRIIPKYPVWGTGIDNFAEGVVREMPSKKIFPIDKPHSYPLEMAATMGLPATMVYFSLIILILWRGFAIVRRRGPDYELVFAGCLTVFAYMIALAFLFSTVNNGPLFYLALGLAAAAVGGARSASQSEAAKSDAAPVGKSI